MASACRRVIALACAVSTQITVPATVTAKAAAAHTIHAQRDPDAGCPALLREDVSAAEAIGSGTLPISWSVASTWISVAGATSEATIRDHFLLCLYRQQRVKQLKR